MGHPKSREGTSVYMSGKLSLTLYELASCIFIGLALTTICGDRINTIAPYTKKKKKCSGPMKVLKKKKKKSHV